MRLPITFVLVALVLSLPHVAPARVLSKAPDTPDDALLSSSSSRSLQQAAFAARVGVAVSVIEALAPILNVAKDQVEGMLNANNFQVSQPYKGALWVSNVDGRWGSWNGNLLSAYYHPTR